MFDKNKMTKEEIEREEKWQEYLKEPIEINEDFRELGKFTFLEKVYLWTILSLLSVLGFHLLQDFYRLILFLYDLLAGL